jgi:ABC-type antimicrobial peptide transport system permease subunit
MSIITDWTEALAMIPENVRAQIVVGVMATIPRELRQRIVDHVIDGLLASEPQRTNGRGPSKLPGDDV